MKIQGAAAWRLAVATLVLYAAALLSIGIREDWRLMHEDNGAIFTTLALSHVRLGLARTRAHDLFFEPATGRGAVYGHHPPAMALLVAGAFRLAGSDAPWVARCVVIPFHLGSLLLLLSLLRRFFSARASLVGGFLFATVPMSAFFGRMVDYEPVCLFAVLLQLYGFVRLEQSGWQIGMPLVALGIAFGGLVDWAAFFFAGAIACVAAFRAWSGEARAWRRALQTAGLAAAVLLLDVGHLWWSQHGSLDAMRPVLPGNSYRWPDLAFCLGQLENFRRYFTLAGLDASLLTALSLAWPGSRLARRLFDAPESTALRGLLWAAGPAAAAYVLAAPFWAAKHAYWQFYFLPFAVFSMVLAGRFLWNTAGRARVLCRALCVVFALEFLATSAYVLQLRHTRVGDFAVAQTAKFRSNYLAPESARAP